MIRLAPNQRPESWTSIEINLDGEPQPLRVRYWLLSTLEAADWAAKRLRGLHAMRADEEAGFDYLLGQLSAEHIGQIRAMLLDRILDWDLEDAEQPGAKLPVTMANVTAVVDHGAFFRPLFQGLIDASSGDARKNGLSG